MILCHYFASKKYSQGESIIFVVPMATGSSSVSTDPKLNLIKQIRTHEVAIAELGSLSSSRTVYQKNGHLFFRTTVQKAKSFDEKQLDQAKAKLERLNSQ